MDSKPEDVRPNGKQARSVDDFDRKILGALTDDARLTYAEVGRIAGLSAPAVHERVRRLKASGVLAGTTACIEPASVGKPFLAFVHVNAALLELGGWAPKIKRFPEVEEIHSVAGDNCVILKVRTASAQAMEQFLSQLYVLPGVRATKSFVVLSTYVERPVQATVTSEWPEIPLPRA